jgi:hypothetical protein
MQRLASRDSKPGSENYSVAVHIAPFRSNGSGAEGNHTDRFAGVPMAFRALVAKRWVPLVGAGRVQTPQQIAAA